MSAAVLPSVPPEPLARDGSCRSGGAGESCGFADGEEDGIGIAALSQQFENIMAFLPLPCFCALVGAAATQHQDFAPLVAVACERAWRQAVPAAAVRQHYSDLFGSADTRTLLTRRASLLAVDAKTKLAQWRTQTSVARLLHGVPLDGQDLFAALKRCYFASQVTALAAEPGVVRWMHVLDAIEDSEPARARAEAGEAWRALLAAQLLTPDTLLWAAQTAHFVEALPQLPSWLLSAGASEQPTGKAVPPATIRAWLQLLEGRLAESAAAGRYGPVDDSQTLRVRHLAAVRTRL
eukprot:TRINITY_DN21539_c0_g2_i1.p1 TRINITY_DN21539_c0_g2~~TRINITY_DN21539_c0_g2_i1.p1  ORF type:complete len:293 (+),score=78.62 TRINITY_DN21539_c0_g2_i1:150-1028(+)